MRTSKTSGFTIIETIVSVLVIGVVVVMYSVGINTYAVSRDSKNQDIATHIAANKMEAIRAAGYAALATSTAFTDPLLSSIPQGAASTTATAINAYTKQVDVIVGWVRDTHPRSITLTTLMTSNGGLK